MAASKTGPRAFKQSVSEYSACPAAKKHTSKQIKMIGIHNMATSKGSAGYVYPASGEREREATRPFIDCRF